MSEYDKQAKEFLQKTNCQIIMQQIRPELAFRPLWATDNKIQHGHEYRVAIIRNDGRDYRFSFWDSIANAQTHKKPTAYDILACLNPNHNTDFNDWCDEYGYDHDSRDAWRTFKAVRKESEALHKLFSEKELDMLAEVQ